MSRKGLARLAMALLCLAVAATTASAQVFTGRIDVTAKDGTGAVLPGVTVELSGVQATSSVTDTRGEAHFLNLAPGRYTVEARLSGFNTYRNENVPVNAGSVIPLEVTLTVSGVSESVTVAAETPVIEAKRPAVATNVSLDELQRIPTSRDPWVVLQTVPGVIVDRVNVGGAESGQQSNYKAKGAGVNQNTWNMDGVAITDMAALGSSPTYYDFDMFQEMRVTTGGADVTSATPGVQLDFVLRSGTNNWRGSGRYYFENKDLQSDNLDPTLAGQITSYNRVNKYFDTGAEGGGPILKDKLFVWGAYGRTEPRLEIYSYTGPSGATFINQTPDCKPLGTSSTVGPNVFAISARDCTKLVNYSGKATAEISNSTRASFTYFRGNKQKFGRSASATRPAETTWNQDGPTEMFKGEINHTFGNSLFATARYAHINSGFSFEPQGGLDTTVYRDDNRVYHGTYYEYTTDRPQDTLAFEANYFKGNHELKAGLGWRRSLVDSSVVWPGGIYSFHRNYPNIEATIVRDWASSGEGLYWNGYVGDTYTRDRLTINAGLRWDRSAASIRETSVPANPLSDLLPAITAPAVKNAVVWNTITPRIGVAYALGAERKTLVRASYSMFAAQLDSNFAATVASAIPYYSYVYWAGTDTNGNNRLDPSEFTTFQGTYGFDPENPLGGNPDKIGKYKTPKTHEVLLGAEHELMPNFGVTGTFTWRKYTDFNWLHFRGVTGADYTQAGTVSGNDPVIGSYNVPYYAVNPDAVPADFGRVFEARDGYTQRYLGFEVAATKRMSNNWMMRMAWSSGANREYFSGPEAQADPTPSPPGTSQFTLLSPNKDGGLVLEQTAGSGKSSIYLASPKYQYILTGAYQAPWGINLGLNYLFRQGFASPYYMSSVPGSADDISGTDKTVLLVSDVDQNRLPNVHSFDARVSKNLKYDRFSLDLDLDMFNLFNASTTLGRQFDSGAGNFNQILEIENPRIIRLGVRVSFN
ncbi:MAG: carboxypeptidase regulatory-like domain-containing protein [Vicinamibacterales bacterium]